MYGVFLKGIIHQFWIYNIFFVPHRKKHFLWKVHLDKTTLTRKNWEKRMHKVSPTKYYYIYYIYNTDCFITRSLTDSHSSEHWTWGLLFCSLFCSIQLKKYMYYKLYNDWWISVIVDWSYGWNTTQLWFIATGTKLISTWKVLVDWSDCGLELLWTLYMKYEHWKWSNWN